MSTFDLNNPPQDHKVSVSVESKETKGELYVRLGKDVALFAVAVSFVILMVYLCVETLKSASASTEEKKWAMSMISAVTGGLVGYLVKK